MSSELCSSTGDFEVGEVPSALVQELSENLLKRSVEDAATAAEALLTFQDGRNGVHFWISKHDHQPTEQHIRTHRVQDTQH